MSSVLEIAPETVAQLASKGPIDLIDVRTPAEYTEIHARPARSVPLDRLDPAAIVASRVSSPDQPIYVICKGGNRGKQACEKFYQAGYTNVVNVAGGTLAWEKAGLEVVRGRKMISLERQVRIIAGSLVLIGAVLGGLVNPWFCLISGFVGAGLVFAGVTDTCGMALILARMPWNQRTC
jgi:rhodanese-related sulfurtransferase